MRKTLTALAVAATAFAAPMLASGTAYAAVVPALPAPGVTLAVDTTAVSDIINRAIGGGCTTTYVGQVDGQPIGGVVTIAGLIVTVNGYTAENYTFAQEGHTVAFVLCMV